MIDKISGKVAYAVISFGGFLGMGEDYYPMPWASLKYDNTVGGYRVGVTEDQLMRSQSTNLLKGLIVRNGMLMLLTLVSYYTLIIDHAR